MRGRDRCKSSINTASLLYLWGMRNSLIISCGECRLDYKAVSLYLCGFPELHLSCLLNLKGQNAYTETYRGGTFGAKFGLKNW